MSGHKRVDVTVAAGDAATVAALLGRFGMRAPSGRCYVVGLRLGADWVRAGDRSAVRVDGPAAGTAGDCARTRG